MISHLDNVHFSDRSASSAKIVCGSPALYHHPFHLVHGRVEREVRDDFPDQRLYSGIVRVCRYYPEQIGNIEGKFWQ